MRPARAFLAAGALSLLLAACATPETRVRKALTRVGVSEPIATCMADRMADRLSLLQLDKLNRLGKLKKTNFRQVTFDEFVRLTKGLQDPEILAVVTSSGVICWVRS